MSIIHSHAFSDKGSNLILKQSSVQNTYQQYTTSYFFSKSFDKEDVYFGL